MAADISALLRSENTFTVPLKPFYSKLYKPTVVVRVERGVSRTYRAPVWYFSVKEDPSQDESLAKLIEKLNLESCHGDVMGLSALRQIVDMYAQEFRPAVLVELHSRDFICGIGGDLRGLIENIFACASYKRMLTSGRLESDSAA